MIGSGPIRLGLMPPLSGIVGLYGPGIERAARIACAEINAAGGVLGRPLELVVEDDGSAPDPAVRAACRLAEEHGCVALIGTLLSNSRLAVARVVATRLRLPYLNFSFYEGSISDPYFFHFAALPNQQIAPLVPWLANHHGPKMFFAGHNYEWPRGSIDAAKRCLAETGGEVLGEAYFDFGISDAHIEELLGEAIRSGADVFLPFFAGSEQLRVLQRFAELGMHARMAVATCHFDDVMAARLAPDARAGVYSCNTYFTAVDTPANHEFLRQWRALAPAPDPPAVSNFAEGAYLCVKAFAQAVELAGSVATEALVAALRHTRIDAPQGVVEMDPLSQHARVNIYLARGQREGGMRIVEHFGQRAPTISARYAEAAQSSGEDAHAVARVAPSAQAVLAAAEAPIVACDAQDRIVEVNAAACAMFGYGQAELLGEPIHLLLPPHMRTRHARFVDEFRRSPARIRNMHERGELTGYRSDGSFVAIEAAIAKLDGGDGGSLVVTLRDIGARRRIEQELRWRANHDLLTGLPNRSLIRERIEQSLQRARRQAQSVAVLFIDLDGFKLINDTYGHAVGDSLLRQLAQRLLTCVRPGDTVGRMSGDEFVVLGEQIDTAEQAIRLAEQINAALRAPFALGGQGVFVTAAIGVALGSGDDAEQLLRAADTAMYEAKSSAGGGWRLYTDALAERARQRIEISQGLHGVIERDELCLYVQPIVEAVDGHVVAGELLLRWHSAQGEVAPAQFVPIAEVNGAILPIGAWVFRRACELEVEWRRRLGAAMPRYLAVNVSVRQLGKPDLDADFAAILADTGARPEHLLLEITETSLMADVESNLGVLRRLAAMGMRIAVDDFGTGYSSLSQLTRMPVSVMKVDRAFVGGAETRPENRAVIRAIIGLGRALGLTLLAEGVETEAQLREVVDQGCQLAQGFLFHRPMPLADFERLLLAQQSALPA